MTDEKASAAWHTPPPVGKYRENHKYNEFRTICIMFMELNINDEVPQEVEKQMFQDFITIRNMYKRKGEAYREQQK